MFPKDIKWLSLKGYSQGGFPGEKKKSPIFRPTNLELFSIAGFSTFEENPQEVRLPGHIYIFMTPFYWLLIFALL